MKMTRLQKERVDLLDIAERPFVVGTHMAFGDCLPFDVAAYAAASGSQLDCSGHRADMASPEAFAEMAGPCLLRVVAGPTAAYSLG